MQEKLYKLMEQQNITFGELAKTLGVSKQTLTRKFKGSTEWTYPEMMTLAQVLKIEEVGAFFF